MNTILSLYILLLAPADLVPVIFSWFLQHFSHVTALTLRRNDDLVRREVCCCRVLLPGICFCRFTKTLPKPLCACKVWAGFSYKPLGAPLYRRIARPNPLKALLRQNFSKRSLSMYSLGRRERPSRLPSGLYSAGVYGRRCVLSVIFDAFCVRASFSALSLRSECGRAS